MAQNGSNWTRDLFLRPLKLRVLYLNSIYTFRFVSLTRSFLALFAGFLLVHIPSSLKYQPCFQNLANLGLQSTLKFIDFCVIAYALNALTAKNRLKHSKTLNGKVGQLSKQKIATWFKGLNCQIKTRKYNPHESEIIRGFGHVLRRLDNERSCPLGNSIPRKIECHSACSLVAFYLCSGQYISKNTHVHCRTLT